ncbi:Arc-like DNA binding domain protein [compost metagenome]
MRPLKQAVYSSRTADKFVVRLPDGMRERIAEVARTHHRSMNSEIIARLERSMDLPDTETVEVEAPEGTIWNPSINNLVRTKAGQVGTITEFREVHHRTAVIQAKLDHLHWFDISDLKPVFVKA